MLAHICAIAPFHPLSAFFFFFFFRGLALFSSSGLASEDGNAF